MCSLDCMYHLEGLLEVELARDSLEDTEEEGRERSDSFSEVKHT